jgi:hypothetical protein
MTRWLLQEYLLDRLDDAHRDPPHPHPRHLGYDALSRVVHACYWSAASDPCGAPWARWLRSVLPVPVPVEWTDECGAILARRLQRHRARRARGSASPSYPDVLVPSFRVVHAIDQDTFARFAVPILQWITLARTVGAPPSSMRPGSVRRIGRRITRRSA